MLQSFLGNEDLKRDLQAALRAGRLSHSVLLCGQEGCGAGYAARCLAADYLYPQGGPQAQAVMESRAAECLEVRGEGASGEIKIDRIRQIRRQVFETALSAQGRVVILYGVQHLNQSSANALLKVLEEPPQGVLFVLTASSAAAVLPTIRSRCSQYTVAPVSPQQCSQWLAQHCPKAPQRELLALVYDGCIGRAAHAAQDPAGQKNFQTACTIAGQLAAGSRYQVLCSLAAYERDKPGAQQLLSDLAALGSAALSHPGCCGLSPHQGAVVAAACGQAQEEMARNVNLKLLLTNLAVRLTKQG